MGSARTRVLIVCGAGTRAQRKAPDPGTQLPTPRERPRRGGTVPCPRSHNGDGNRGWEVKSPGSRWEACRNPSRSRLAGGSSVQFLLACQPLVHWRGEINRSRRQKVRRARRAAKMFHDNGGGSKQPRVVPSLRCVLLGGAWFKGVGFYAPWLYAQQVFLLCENAGVWGDPAPGLRVAEPLVPVSKATAAGEVWHRPAGCSCQEKPARAWWYAVRVEPRRRQTGKLEQKKTKVAVSAPGPRRSSALSPPRVGTCGAPEGDAVLKPRLFVPGFSAERREAVGSQPRWLCRKEKKWVY